jgi:hypothetical protein
MQPKNFPGRIATVVEAPDFDNTRSADEQRDFIPSDYAHFNHCDHLCVNVPDGGFTITTRDSQGKRMTLHFGVYEKGGAPQFVDIVYHDNGTTRDNGGRILPTFDAIGFGAPMGRSVFDTRNGEHRTSLICILTPKEG